jgi:hypothetical protein
MATFQRKALTVEARVYDGPKLTVVSDEKGQQTATAGDYLVGSERGKITVVSKADFEKDFDVPAVDVPEYPKTLADGRVVVTESGKTQEELDADLAKIAAEAPVHFATIGEAQDYVTANLKPGDTFEFTVGDDPTVQTAK